MVSGLGPRGPLGPGGPHVSRTHVIPFDDHASQRALTVFDSTSPLPFLYSYSFYFTHQDASPDTSHAQELYKALTSGSLYDTNDVEYRLDFYFLPGASQDDCIAHYHAEKAARGTYKAQIDALASGGGGGSGRVPGLVDSYAAHNKMEFRYHGLIHVCDVPDWRAGEQLLQCVEFDPLSQEDYEKFNKDPGDHREPDVLPATQAWPAAVTEGSPGFGRELPRPYFGVRALENLLWQRFPRQRASEEVWEEARDRGWTTW